MDMNSKWDPESKELDARRLTVLHSRSVADLPRIQSDLLETDFRSADLFLRFVRETSAAREDRDQLRSLIRDFTFKAFPHATHLVLVIEDPLDGKTKPWISESRSGEEPEIALSSTLVNKVMTEGVSLVFTHSDGGASKSESIVASGIRTALCAPLASAQGTFGIIQLDIRGNNRGNFSKKDVDRIAVFASHMGLILENYRLYLDQRRAFESTISALVHSLSLKDPATADHSMRVRNVSVYLGLQQGLSDRELESLRVAPLLHDMGKQGISDDVLLKPGRLSDTEREEMSQHSEMTQNILDKIAYPPHLKDVPTLAAYHHEKMNGSGPFKLVGRDIPIQSRIIAIADVFDALVSARVYKKPMSPEQALAILDKGKNIEFDPQLVDTLRSCIAGIMEEIYSDSDTEADLAA